jgi:hypothetical protein
MHTKHCTDISVQFYDYVNLAQTGGKERLEIMR